MELTPISPTINLPIKSESVNIDIAPTSQYGKDYDVARITSIIVLQEPLETSQKFLLPKSEELWSPKLTTEDGTQLQFSLDGTNSCALEQLKQTLKEQSDKFLEDPSIDNRSLLTDLQNQVYQLSQYTTEEEVPAGTQLIKFSFAKPIKKNDVGEYVLKNLVPMASFSMQNGSKVHALIAMPFDPFISADNVEGTWTNPDTNESSIMSETHLDSRTVLSAFWQKDPMLTIKYKY